MKRSWGILGALAALLACAPAPAATYWVSPTGGYGRTSTRTGADSTAGVALSLAWANDSASAGDIIRLKSSCDIATMSGGNIPQYNQPIRPEHGGTNGSPIRYLGFPDAPGAVKVAYVEIDTAAGATGYISVYGVRAEKTAANNGHLKMNSQCATARYDSVAYCTFDAGINVYCRSYSTVTNCSFGTGIAWPRPPSAGTFASIDKVHITGHYGGTPVYQHCCNAQGNPYNVSYDGTAIEDSTHGAGAWLTNFRLSNNTFNIGSDASDGNNAMTWRLYRGCTIDSNTFTLKRYGPTSTSGTNSLHTNYYAHNNEWTDNTFTGWVEYPADDFYLLNLRDWQQRNKWRRNTFLQDPNSPRTVKVMLLTSGNDEYLPAGSTGSRVDPGSRRNLFDGNFIRVKGTIGYQDRSPGDTLQFNTFLVQNVLNVGSAYSAAARSDSLVFWHNTVATFTANGRSTNTEKQVDTTTYSRFTHNIFASMALVQGQSTAPHYEHHTVMGRGTAVADSNLYWCYGRADSAEIKSDSYSVGPTGIFAYKAAVGRELASYFGNPAFTDTAWATFNGWPDEDSIAVGGRWGGDNFVGAQGPPAGGSADATPPVVTITAPEENQGFQIGETVDIYYGATDDVAVTRIDIDRGLVKTSGTTWVTLKHNIVPTSETSSWFWNISNTGYSTSDIRVTAWDAANNSHSYTVRIRHGCSTCASDDPFREVP